jgi:hypothetical protein
MKLVICCPQHAGFVQSVFSTRTEPEFIDVPGRLKRYLFTKRYLFRGQAAQQGFQLLFWRVVDKIILYIFTRLQFTDILMI